MLLEVSEEAFSRDRILHHSSSSVKIMLQQESVVTRLAPGKGSCQRKQDQGKYLCKYIVEISVVAIQVRNLEMGQIIVL